MKKDSISEYPPTVVTGSLDKTDPYTIDINSPTNVSSSSGASSSKSAAHMPATQPLQHEAGVGASPNIAASNIENDEYWRVWFYDGNTREENLSHRPKGTTKTTFYPQLRRGYSFAFDGRVFRGRHVGGRKGIPGGLLFFFPETKPNNVSDEHVTLAWLTLSMYVFILLLGMIGRAAAGMPRGSSDQIQGNSFEGEDEEKGQGTLDKEERLKLIKSMLHSTKVPLTGEDKPVGEKTICLPAEQEEPQAANALLPHYSPSAIQNQTSSASTANHPIRTAEQVAASPLVAHMWSTSTPCCSICLSPYVEGEYISRSARNEKCVHVFHQTCIIEWLMRGHEGCPCCRSNYFEVSSTHKDEESTNRSAGHPIDGAQEEQGDDTEHGRSRRNITRLSVAPDPDSNEGEVL